MSDNNASYFMIMAVISVQTLYKVSLVEESVREQKEQPENETE